MSPYRKQSKTPKPQSVSQMVARWKREAQAAGYDVSINYGSGIYTPAINVQAWPKRERKEAQP